MTLEKVSHGNENGLKINLGIYDHCALQKGNSMDVSWL